MNNYHCHKPIRSSDISFCNCVEKKFTGYLQSINLSFGNLSDQLSDKIIALVPFHESNVPSDLSGF